MRSRLKRYRSLYPVSTIRLPFAGIDRQNDKTQAATAIRRLSIWHFRKTIPETT
jgi:hypothetical protein